MNGNNVYFILLLKIKSKCSNMNELSFLKRRLRSAKCYLRSSTSNVRSEELISTQNNFSYYIHPNFCSYKKFPVVELDYFFGLFSSQHFPKFPTYVFMDYLGKEEQNFEENRLSCFCLIFLVQS